MHELVVKSERGLEIALFRDIKVEFQSLDERRPLGKDVS